MAKSMLFEWDERKRLRILGYRAIDFVSAPRFFDGRLPFTSRRRAKARIDGKDRRDRGAFFTLVWTWRGDAIRIISMRRA